MKGPDEVPFQQSVSQYVDGDDRRFIQGNTWRSEPKRPTRIGKSWMFALAIRPLAGSIEDRGELLDMVEEAPLLLFVGERSPPPGNGVRSASSEADRIGLRPWYLSVARPSAPKSIKEDTTRPSQNVLIRGVEPGNPRHVLFRISDAGPSAEAAADK